MIHGRWNWWDEGEALEPLPEPEEEEEERLNYYDLKEEMVYDESTTED